MICYKRTAIRVPLGGSGGWVVLADGLKFDNKLCSEIPRTCHVLNFNIMNLRWLNPIWI